MSHDGNSGASIPPLASAATSAAPQQPSNATDSDAHRPTREMAEVARSTQSSVAISEATAASHSDRNRSNSNADEVRHCWVCFASDEDDELAAWTQPCRCSGTTKWVHQACLQRWVDEKQKGNSFKRVNCPQCQTEYIIIFPEMGTFVGILEGIDTIVKRLSPFLAAGVIVGSLYWTAVTYGAVTVLQVLGHKNGLEVLERSDPLVLLIGLPAIPAGLIFGRMIMWEEMILRFIQNRQNSVRKYPLLNFVLPLP